MADPTYQPKTYREQGGDRFVVASDGSLDVESGGEIDFETGAALKIAGTQVDSTAAEINILSGVTAIKEELNLLDGAIASAVPILTAGGTTDEMDITITVKDAAGTTIADSHYLTVWITADADALTLTGATASGALTAVDGGILSVLTAKKHITCVTPATGIINLSLIDSNKAAGQFVVVLLPNGLFSISAASASGSYQ